MNTIGSADKRGLFLATAPATRRQRRVAATIAVVAFLAFVTAVPFVRVPLMPMPAFIPSYEFALIFIDLVTAVLLFEQFLRLRAASLLALATGYLFDAMIIVPHALTFPGAFAPEGLLGAGPQTTAWLYVFWHGGFPLFVMAYVWLSRREEAGALDAIARPTAAVIGASAAVAALTVVFTLLATVGHDRLPLVMQGSNYSMLVTKGVSPAVWALTLIAMLMLWPRRQRVLDLWLMLVMWIWLFDIGLAAVIGSARFDLGFYVGRIFGLIASSFLLMMLLAEMAKLYTGALGAAREAEQRFAELAQLRARLQTGPLGRERGELFVIRRNIANFREMLASGKLDEQQRRSITALLAEEEAKLDKEGGS
jgi:two-component system sensor histidine kinase/response regulator